MRSCGPSSPWCRACAPSSRSRQIPPTIRIGGRLTKSQYQYTLQGSDIRKLYRYAPLLEAKMRSLPGLREVTSDLQITNPQVEVDIDRDKAAELGVSMRSIEDTLYYAYGTRQVSTIYSPDNQYQVIMELEPQYQRDPAALGMLYVHSDSGALVPLSALARLTAGVGPLAVTHSGTPSCRCMLSWASSCWSAW